MLGVSLILICLIIFASVVIITIAFEQQRPSYAQVKQFFSKYILQELSVPLGSHPHDVAPSTTQSGIVWYTAQGSGKLGKLDPGTGKTHEISLGQGWSSSWCHCRTRWRSVDYRWWVEFHIRLDPLTEKERVFPLPLNSSNVNLNTATFDHHGILWFMDRVVFMSLFEPSAGKIEVFKAPRGPGPYGITTTPKGDVYYASLAGAYIARINLTTGYPTILEPPTQDQGARRLWSDSQGRLWVSEWNAGKLALYDPTTNKWQE